MFPWMPMARTVGGAAPSVTVADYYSTVTWAGNDSTDRTISTLDLSSGKWLAFINRLNATRVEGWCVWSDGTSVWQTLMYSNSTPATGVVTGAVGGLRLLSAAMNATGGTYVAHIFKGAPGAQVFDVVPYTGTASNMTVAHGLGAVPVWVACGRYSASGQRGLLRNYGATFINTAFSNSTLSSPAIAFQNTLSDASNLYIGTGNNNVNSGSASHYALVLGPGIDNAIRAGNYTGNGSTTGPIINVGGPIQALIYQRTVSGGGQGFWCIDTERTPGWTGNESRLNFSATTAEATAANFVQADTDGVQIVTTDSTINTNGDVYHYLAVKAPPP
jgi:hypothetical protein